MDNISLEEGFDNNDLDDKEENTEGDEERNEDSEDDDVVGDDDNEENDDDEEEEEGLSYDEFCAQAEANAPGHYLGEIEIAGGMMSWFCHTSIERSEDGYYIIYIVPEPEPGGPYPEPEYVDYETIGEDEIKKWLKDYGFDESVLDSL